MKPRYIAAIEIGSARIKGVVASVDDTMTIRILAVEEIDSGEAVRYGRVQNAREVGERVSEVVRRLENAPHVMPGRIDTIFVAAGGRSLSSSQAEAIVNLGGEAEITPAVVEKLRNEARYNLATDRDVLAIAPRSFTVNNSEVKKVVGAFGHVVKGDFTIITSSPENRRALDHVKIASGEHILSREYITRLLAQTEMALTDSDRQLGCLFVDFGAETTTLCIFKNGAMQLAATLPMGSANITRDLSRGLSMTVESAENLKRTKGRALVERISFQGADDETREVVNYVSARAGEIVANINAYVEKCGYKASDLTAGIVLAGGGARLRGFDEMLEAQTRMKVRHAAVDSSISMATHGKVSDHFDVVSLVKYVASHTDADCMDFPEEPVVNEVAESLAAAGVKLQQPASAPAEKPGGYRAVQPSIDDPTLLDDDPIDQPDNINEDTPLDEINLGSDPNKARLSLGRRLMNWIAPKTDDTLDD